MNKWAKRACEVLAGLRLLPTRDPEEQDRQRKAIRAAYPFGERAMFPYKVWLRECKRLHPWLYSVPQAPLPKWLGGEG